MAKNGKKKNGKKRVKQQQLPGTERQDRIPAIEKQAATYVDARDARMECTKEEVAEKEKLLKVMQENKLEKYICDSEDLEVIVSPSEYDVKVKRRKVEQVEVGG